MSATSHSVPHTGAPFSQPRERPVSSIVETALANEKQECLRLAVKARWISLAIIAALLVFLQPSWSTLYYHACLAGFALIGWVQMKIGRVGHSRPELFLLFCDLALMTYVLIAPNPLLPDSWPLQAKYLLDNFVYFYVLLAGAVLAYHWRTLIAMGVWVTALWLGAAVWLWWLPSTQPDLTTDVAAAVADVPGLGTRLDPNAVHFPERIKEVVVFLIVAWILALSSWRANRLLISHAAVERERANLVRYFSPNVVEELSQNDEPLKQTRTQNVAVLFVDIFGFTALADDIAPDRVIGTLRDFHARMEQEVFRHGGTLDKYLGDGLMATFGTPSCGDSDAGDALRCARAMIDALDACNRERAARGEIPLRAGFGLHYGPVVLGDIGANRLEFAVIGSSVNIASRLEGLTRELDVDLIASADLIEQARREPASSEGDFASLEQRPPQRIRGLGEPLAVWTLAR